MTVTQMTPLQEAYDGSWYTIVGTGGDLQEWVDGYEKLLAEAGVGKPETWTMTTGALVNDFMFPGGWTTEMNAAFPVDLTFLMFPLTGLNVGRLAMFKLKAQDRWFDDIVDNSRRR